MKNESKKYIVKFQKLTFLYTSPPSTSPEKKKNGKARILPLEYDKKAQRNREAYTTWAFSIKLQRINLILI